MINTRNEQNESHCTIDRRVQRFKQRSLNRVSYAIREPAWRYLLPSYSIFIAFVIAWLRVTLPSAIMVILLNRRVSSCRGFVSRRISFSNSLLIDRGLSRFVHAVVSSLFDLYTKHYFLLCLRLRISGFTLKFSLRNSNVTKDVNK